MLPSFLLSLREGLEAALIIGIVLGALYKLNRTELSSMIWWGAGLATLLSIIAAIFLMAIGTRLEGKAEAIYEGIAMLMAAGLLTWMIFWMQKQAGSIKGELESDVRKAVFGNNGSALFFIAFLAVGREGLELALFLTAATFTSEALITLPGAVLGLATAACLGYLLFSGTRRLNLKAFFLVTNLLLILFAAGLVAHGVHELNEASLIPPVIEHVWDTNGVLDENSMVGLLLKTLFGYNGNPSLTEITAYLTYLGFVGFIYWKINQPARVQSSPAI